MNADAAAVIRFSSLDAIVAAERRNSSWLPESSGAPDERLAPVRRGIAGSGSFLTLALPVTVLAGVLVGGISAIARALGPRVFAILAVPLVGLLLYVQYRLKATRDDLRKIFHM
jgi:hypothetical protein